MKKILFCLFVFMIPFIVNGEELELAKNAKSAILIEASTGEVIYENNADVKYAPASMTKMMSMLLVVEAIEKGFIGWDDVVTVSKNASSMGGSQILLETGEQMKVEDLFKGVAIASGNDAVVALAEATYGTEDEFVKMMNKRAFELGLLNTNFKNPHGLDTINHYSSARDMSIIARELVKHEIVLKYTSIYETYLRENLPTKIWLVNTNKLVRFYKDADGLKTGYTKEAGYCLTATAKRNGMRLIAVVMGEEDSNTRNSEVISMLDYGFSQYKLDVLLSKNDDLGKIDIYNGIYENVGVSSSKNISFLKKKIDVKNNYEYRVERNNVKAPLKKGDKVGTIYVYDGDNLIEKVKLVANKSVKKIGFIKLLFRYLKRCIVGVFSV